MVLIGCLIKFAQHAPFTYVISWPTKAHLNLYYHDWFLRIIFEATNASNVFIEFSFLLIVLLDKIPISSLGIMRG